MFWARIVLVVTLAIVAASGGNTSAQVPAPAEFVKDQLIVRLRPDATGASLAALLSRLAAIDVRSFESLDGLYVFALRPGTDVAEAERIAQTVDGVAYAEPNYVVSRGATVPNDPSFGQLWGLHNTGQTGGVADADIDAPEAWDVTTGSSDVVVAILDTGIDYSHPDLAANMFRNEADCNTNGVDDDGNLYIDDCYGIDTYNRDSNPMDDNNHGTHVAGTIGAAGDNAIGVTGVNWHVKLMPCKFLGASGSGSTSDAITCLEYVAAMKDRGINIVATNNSWGGGAYSQAMFDAIEAQRQRGILFIAAAGNGGSNNDVAPHYPASYDVPNMVAVANTTASDALSGSSSYGRFSVHLGAPGSGILSTVPGSGYQTFSGTSMATPHVTGVAALLKAQDPGRDWRAIRNLLLSGGDSTSALNGKTLTGKRLNAYGSLSCTTATAFARVLPRTNSATTTVGSGIAISAVNIACATGAGNVAVSVSGGASITLVDDGSSPDKVAGDGVYAGTYTPMAAGSTTLTFPDATSITVHALEPTAYSAESIAYAYRSITGLNLQLGDDTAAAFSTPFPISFGGSSFNTLYVGSNGTISVDTAHTAYTNAALPVSSAGTLLAALWDDLLPVAGTESNVFWADSGVAPNRELIIEWRNVARYSCPSTSGSFQIVFFEGRSDIVFNYADVVFGSDCSFADNGASATIGVQSSPSHAAQYSLNTASISNGTSLRFALPGTSDVFIDSPLVALSTTVRAVHIVELRMRIDRQRERFGLSKMVWTDPALIAGVTVVKAQHLLEVRAALTAAFTAAGLDAPAFAEPIGPGTLMRASQIAELRDLVISLETR